MAEPNYFTCTLGQAASLNLTDASFKNITAFLDQQAKYLPDSPAVGFACPPIDDRHTQPWTHKIYTFRDLAVNSTFYQSSLRDLIGTMAEDRGTVALLCPSTANFVFAWLGLMRLGFAVLLVAPQCQATAIAHLCSSTNASVLLYDEQFTEQAKQTAAIASGRETSLQALLLPGLGDHPERPETPEPTTSSPTVPGPFDIAYLHHTSGTSSGLPKPIPQSHRAGAGVLPHFPQGREAATFTTTPLYHGGVADSFRAWTSGAMIWLFPGKGVPITAMNIVKCLDVASDLVKSGKAPPVKYFSSVPYVLQCMEADTHGLRHLQAMEIVGVGGAALPAEVGDRLVSANVNLISRFGSAECGFLMSSHRDYARDKEWQYLRSSDGSERLSFLSRGDGLFELVIRPGWPHMAKRNKDDGSFATADLFAPHPSIANAWRYHSRADSQLTLITGKKFDPAPLEDSIKTSELVEDVLIFGNGQALPGALLFRSLAASNLPNAELISRLWPGIEKLNAESQGHARLLRKMLIPMPKLAEPLEKSSKGTVIRNAAEKRFADQIVAAYLDEYDGLDNVPDGEVQQTIIEQIRLTLNRSKPPQTSSDLFAYGVDSVAGIQIRTCIQRLLPRGVAKTLPLNIVEDCGTVERLTEFVLRTRHGQAVRDIDDEEQKLMLELVEKYGHFGTAGQGSVKDPAETHTQSGEDDDDDDGDTIILTGVTGALGAHVLDIYSHEPTTKHIYCLVRGATGQACRERVAKALASRRLRSLRDDRVTVLRADLGDPRLGLEGDDYARLARETTKILHIAWAVNFRMRLRAFERDHIGGLHNLLGLALESPRRTAPLFGFCSSVASVLASSHRPIPESISTDPRTSSPLGYSRSKWVAEAVCARAAAAVIGGDGSSTGTNLARLKGRVTVFRVGQLGGDRVHGVWNASEAWPLMLAVGIKRLHALPDLAGEKLDWLPVDVAAMALVEGLRHHQIETRSAVVADEKMVKYDDEVLDGGRTGHERVAEGGDPEGNTVGVAHVVHDGENPGWSELLGWLQQERGGGGGGGGGDGFDVVGPSEWVGLLEQQGVAGAAAADAGDVTRQKSLDAKSDPHPAYKLLELWKSAYGSECPDGRRNGGKRGGGKESVGVAGNDEVFAMARTKAAIPVLREVEPLDRDHVVKIWRWIDENM